MRRPLPFASRLALILPFVGLFLVATLTSAARLDDLPPKQRKDLVDLATLYLDPNDASWSRRKAFKEHLESLQAIRPLADLEFLQDLLYEGRHFLPDYSDKSWLKDNGAKLTKGPYMSVEGAEVRFSYVVPKGYPSEREIKRKKVPPYPLVIALHEGSDYHKDSAKAGAEVLDRRLGRRTYAALHEQALMLAPVVAYGRWADQAGVVRPDIFARFADFWKRFHVDFDRVILDAGSSGLDVLAAQPVFYAGMVLHKPASGQTRVDPAVVSNYAAVPIYVLGDEAAAAALEEAGHPNVTRGDGSDLVQWMMARRREVPKSFRWVAGRADMLLAWWVNLDTPDWNAKERWIEVECLDSEDDPNTIKVAARGIEKATFFLNDRLVDLERPVRFVVNGVEEVVEAPGRDFQTLFQKEPVEIRRSMYWGWLYPARVVRDIPEPSEASGGGDAKPVEASEESVVKGTPEDEEEAANLWTGADKKETEGNLAAARTLYQRIVELGETSLGARAAAKVQALTEAIDKGEKRPAQGTTEEGE